MAKPHLFHAADFGGETADILDAAGKPLYKSVSLVWSRPRLWEKGENAPIQDEDGPCVYALIRNHGKALTKDRIAYVGLTRNPQNRFANHTKAWDVVERRGQVGLSLAPVNFVRGKNRIENLKAALEEIEHILIWSVPEDYLENDRKLYTLPGMGSNGGNAWHIRNEGYRFCGQMPREIIYPWMLEKLGRDRSAKKR